MKRYLSFHLFLSVCLTAISLFSFNRTHSQVSLQWSRFYNGPLGKDAGFTAMVIDDLGNVYSTGSTGVPTSKYGHIVTIKYNTSGVLQWQTFYNSSDTNDDVTAAMAIDHLGNIYVTGYSFYNSYGTGTSHLTTIKYNNSGVQQWATVYNGPIKHGITSTAIAVDGSGNVYVTGYAWVSDETTFDYATIKYNSSGVEQWVQIYDGPAHYTDIASAIAVDQVTQDVYVTGLTTGVGTDEDYTTIKYNTNGAMQWARSYNGPTNGQDNAKAIGLDPSGNIYVTGFSGTGLTADYATIKYNKAGIQQWVSRYNGPADWDDIPSDLKVDKFANVYVTGFTDNGTNSADCATLKYDSSGVQQWVQLYNQPANFGDVAYALALDSENNVYITGGTDGRTTSFDYLTIKYNSAGVQQWVQTLDAFTNDDKVYSYDIAYAIAVDKFGDVYVGGRVQTTDFYTPHSYFGILKYIQTPPLTVNAGADTTIYYGYGSGCTNLKAIASGGVPPYTYLWSPAGNNPTDSVNTVCPRITTNYIVTVTDANHSTATDTVRVNVINVRCGNKKVLVCHKGITLCIGEEAVAMHLKHGDKLGMCQLKFGCHISNGFIVENVNDPDQPVQLFALPNQNKDESLIGKISNYPNPFTSATTINYVLPFDAHVSVKVYDMLGKEVAIVVNENKKAGNYSIVFNTSNMASGTYQCQLIAISGTNSLNQSIKLNKIQ